MKANEFHIQVQREKVLLNWGDQQGIPYRLATGLEKDRLIARILHKMLNMRLTEDEEGVFGREEFKVLGSTLFNLLFNDDALQMHFDTFYKEAIGSPEEPHRLILEFDRDADEIATLPWEYLYYEKDEKHEAFLAAHPKKCIDLIRKLPFGGNWLELDKTQQMIEPPLQVLIIAAVANVNGAIEDIKKSVAYFQNLANNSGNRLEIKVLAQPEVDIFEEQLDAILRNPAPGKPFSPNIIHFIGRSRMDGDMGQLCFVKKTADNQYAESWVNEEIFSGFFEEWTRLPHLIFLHVSDGVRIGNYREDKGIAIKLVKRGVPFVVTLQNPVLSWMVEVLTEKVYDSLLEGADIAAAVTEGRFHLARKLVDPNGNRYDNYAHKIFGSVVLFSSVLKPFALSIDHEQEQSQENVDTYKICVDHPDKKYSLTDNWCSFCGKKLILPSQLQESAKSETRSATNMDDSGRSSTNITQPESAKDNAPKRDASRSSSIRSSSDATTIVETRSTTVSIDAILALERQGLETQLEILIRRLNQLRSDYAIANDSNQKFTLNEQIRQLEEEVEKLKEKLRNQASS